jgi:hypothetical protein
MVKYFVIILLAYYMGEANGLGFLLFVISPLSDCE